MRTLSAPADLAAKRLHASPVYLLQIDFSAPTAKTLRLSDRFVSVLGQEWLPMVASWGNLEEALNTLDVDGRPATAELRLFNTKPIEGKDRLSDLIRTPLNLGGTYEWAFAKVTIYQLFEGLGSGDEIQLGVFFLEDPTEIGEDLLTVRMSDQSLVLETKLRVTQVSRAEFPTCGKDQVGRSIPRLFGRLEGVPAVPVVDGAYSTLNGAISASATTITLTDAADFPASGTGQIDVEQVTWSGKSGDQLTGVTRAVNGTTAEAHGDKAVIFQVKSGANVYRFAIGESVAGFPVKAVTNVRVNGRPARTGPSVQLDETGLVAGKRFAVVSFSVSDPYAFHVVPVGIAGPRVTNFPLVQDQTIDSAGNATWQFLLTPTLQALNAEVGVGVVRRRVTMTFTVISGSFTLSGTNTIKRRDPASGQTITLFTDNAGPSFDFTGDTFEYETGSSLGDETFELNLSGDANGWRFIWEITVYDVSGEITGGGGGGESTAARVIGAVTADVEGMQDDGAGSISGTPNLLLENPADVTRFILTQLFSVAAADLGTTWGATRSSLAAAGYKWAALLEYALFSQLRRKLGEQARSVLYLEAGRWEYEYLADAPAAQLTLDYAKDVSVDLPARLSRTARTDVRNSLRVSSQRDHAAGLFKRLTTVEDLTQPGFPDPLREDLALDLVQDAATADALGAFWLAMWKRQRFQVDAIAWWNVLALETVDYVAIDNHPILAAHGGTALVFRVVGKSYLPGDEHSGRIRLRLIEAGA